jgi:hypothetical protein
LTPLGERGTPLGERGTERDRYRHSTDSHRDRGSGRTGGRGGGRTAGRRLVRAPTFSPDQVVSVDAFLDFLAGYFCLTLRYCINVYM